MSGQAARGERRAEQSSKTAARRARIGTAADIMIQFLWSISRSVRVRVICNVNPRPNFANFVAVSCKKKTKNKRKVCVSRPRFTFRYLLFSGTPSWRWFMRSMCVSLYVFCLPRPLACLLPPAPLSGGDMLEVIITTASGFISIYSHNNTEKWKTDSTGVMYYPVRESSFIMTTNRASSLCHHPPLPMHAHARTHTRTLSFSFPFLPHSFRSPLSTLYHHRIRGASQPVNLCHIIISCGDNSHCTGAIMM